MRVWWKTNFGIAQDKEARDNVCSLFTASSTCKWVKFGDEARIAENTKGYFFLWTVGMVNDRK